MSDQLLISPQSFNPPKTNHDVVLIYNLNYFFRFRELVNGTKVKSFGPSKRFSFGIDSKSVTVLGGLIGAPLAAIAVEQACAYEPKQFLAFGTAGWIGTQKVIVGDLFSPSFGIDYTGLAAEYGATSTKTKFHHLCKVSNCQGIASRNGFFSLDSKIIDQYRGEKIDLIDMEAAPLLFLTKLRKSQFQPLFVVSDVISKDNQWFNGTELPSFKTGIEKGMELLKRTIATI